IQQRDMGLFSLQAAVAMCSFISPLLSGPGFVRSTRDKPSSTILRAIAADSPQPTLGSSSGTSHYRFASDSRKRGRIHTFLFLESGRRPNSASPSGTLLRSGRVSGGFRRFDSRADAEWDGTA